jgi:hypothetical protein
MKTKKVLPVFVLVAIAVLGTVSLLYGGNGNQGGGDNNNACGQSTAKVWIYHKHGDGTFTLKQIPIAAVNGHAQHGDMWYPTGCPLTGPASCY